MYSILVQGQSVFARILSFFIPAEGNVVSCPVWKNHSSCCSSSSGKLQGFVGTFQVTGSLVFFSLLYLPSTHIHWITWMGAGTSV
ncbi:hypothetical protein BP00DRAFT_267881 [Aspergillus indologenus CBS 114.80]|uniref:Uncharacterized protein n=1 Tax=Aspergillus indologenus CBS 114.80 TaxID=1450541 RepID=A0A2V5IER0_9EURO|nr:hypothetical protein BP00DRAFT_267881 [Aspergillus indologenus CBS 114.80]